MSEPSTPTVKVSTRRALIQGDPLAVNGDYEKGPEVAKGRYSRIVEATNKETGQILIVKIYSRNHEPPDRKRQRAIRNELQILEDVGEGVSIGLSSTVHTHKLPYFLV